MRSTACWLIILISSLWTHSTSAQTPTSGLGARNLDPSMVAVLLAASEAVTVPENAAERAAVAQSGPTWQEQRSYRGARWSKATGLGLIAGALIGGFLAGRARHCEYQDLDLNKTAPRITATVVGVVGLGLAIGGGVRMRRIPPHVRRVLDRRTSEHRGMVAAAVGLTLLSTVVIGVAAIPESFQCLSS